jgi:hypothetical protein
MDQVKRLTMQSLWIEAANIDDNSSFSTHYQTTPTISFGRQPLPETQPYKYRRICTAIMTRFTIVANSQVDNNIQLVVIGDPR